MGSTEARAPDPARSAEMPQLCTSEALPLADVAVLDYLDGSKPLILHMNDHEWGMCQLKVFTRVHQVYNSLQPLGI